MKNSITLLQQWRIVSLAMLFSTCLSAQQTTLSTLRGTATDASGAVAPKVAITLVNLTTNISRSDTTNEAGDYEFPDLLNGTYRLTAKAGGFQTFVADNIILESAQTRRVDVRLRVGEQAVEIRVEANAAVIDTESPTISGLLNEQRLEQAPLVANYFDPTLVMTTIPGVVAPSGGSYSLSFNGQKSEQLSEGMDGVSDDGPVNQINNVEDVQELSAITSVATAEYSRAGNFNLIFKSGGNDLHGRLYYTQVNSALGARDFFAPEKTRAQIHTFGFNVSGPIKKNRLFFFGSWNAQRLPGHSYRLATVPTQKMRSGDFSKLPLIQIQDPLNNTPFPGNIIPKQRFAALSQKVQDAFIPAPNLGIADSLSDNLGWVHPRADDMYRSDYMTQRLDYKISDKNTLFGRMITRWTPYYLPGELPDLAWTRKRHHSAMVISDTHVFSPNVVNTARFGWLKDYFVDGEQVAGFQPVQGDQVVQQIGLQGVNPRGYKGEGFPVMSFTGFASLSVVPGGVGQDDRNLSYADTVTWSLNRHVIKFGGELKTFKNFNGFAPNGTYGNFSFDGSMAGFSYADFLLGMPQSSYRLNPLTDRTLNNRELGLFIEDSYKVSRRLNLYYGLRWDYFGSATYDDGLVYNWDPATGNVIVPRGRLNSVSPLYPTNTIKVVEGDPVAHASKTNFRPRLGGAYRITDDTVIRGGYGIFSEQLGRYSLVQGDGPFQIGETFFNSVTNGVPLLSFPSPFPATLGSIPSQSVTGYPMDTTNGLIHQFNLSIEHQINQVGFRLSYIGARDTGLHYSINMNKPQPSLIPFTASRRPYPQLVSTRIYRTDGETKYNALQLEVQKKVGAIAFDVHYTWASSLSNYLNLENPYSPLLWNRDSMIPRQRLVMTTVYQLPFGRGRRFLSQAPGVIDQVLGGWMFTYLGYLQTGQFFTPRFSGADPSRTNSFGGLPDRIANGNLAAGQRRLDHWFDAAAFAPPPPGRFGNSGVNILEGPGYNAHHISIMKRFNFTERMGLEVAAAISNLFNHPNFVSPSSNISVPGQVGHIYGTVSNWDVQKGGPRQMEMKLRLEF